ncbi:hypothetical protein BVRB_2g035450 [Beta vulgaris subsp. vulgaris]|nr:hypothetical protein BVRB_2g035450 [Beta vulgaris subsp. vulgaris]
MFTTMSLTSQSSHTISQNDILLGMPSQRLSNLKKPD